MEKLKENVILFGVGKNYSKQKELLENQYNIIALSDNSIDKQGKIFDGYKCMSPANIINLAYDKIIIMPNDSVEIYNQLLKLGIIENKIIRLLTQGNVNHINFVNFKQLSECIRKNIHKLPDEIDLIVGIPRSGVIPAYIIALFLNKKIVTFTEFINGFAPVNGERPINESYKKHTKEKVLFVDDSICSGSAMAKIRKKLKDINYSDYEFIFLTIFALEENKNMVDYYFQIISLPRIFQWNYMNHTILEKSCVDIDGVLCVNPTTEQNDDGEKYINFCLNAKPLYIPSYEIHTLVTSRLEKYRPQTKYWLKKHNVKYKNLHMLDLPNAELRRNLNIHGNFKAEIYSKLEDTILFIESESNQAKQISELTGKPCICVSTDEYFEIIETSIEEIELVITTKCTLKCKHCAHLIPYYRAINNGKDEYNCDVKEILQTVKKLLDSIDSIEIFRVLGGEPFLHPDMYKIVDELKKSKKVKRLEVVTNGTIIPNGKNLQCLKGENLFIRISNYGDMSHNKEKLINVLESIDVKYSIHDCMKNKWGDLGEPYEIKRTNKELEEIYSKCTAKNIHIIFDGKIYICGRQPHCIKMGFSPEDDFCIDILNGNEDSIKNGIRKLKTVKYLKSCNYCYGRRVGQSYKVVEPAIQFTKEEMENL